MKTLFLLILCFVAIKKLFKENFIAIVAPTFPFLLGALIYSLALLEDFYLKHYH